MCTLCQLNPFTFVPHDEIFADPNTATAFTAAASGGTVTAEGADAAAGTSTSYSLALDMQFDGTISSGSDQDWVSMELVGGTTYIMSAWGHGNVGAGIQDTQLTLYNSSGTQVRYNDDMAFDNAFSSITFTPPSNGTYYLEVEGNVSPDIYGSVITHTGNYTLQLADDVYSVDQVAEFMTNLSWGFPGAFSFDVSAGGTLTYNTSGLTAAGKQMADWAFEAYEMATGINFQLVTGSADITLDDNGAFAEAGPDLLNPATGEITSASVNVPASWNSDYGTTIDSYTFGTYIHEIGHALGLSHPGPYNASATYGTDNLFQNDSWQMTIMSYFSQSENTELDASYALPVSLMLADIVAIRNLYGGEGTANLGNTTWGEGSNVGGYLGAVMDAAATETPNSDFEGNAIAFMVLDDGGTDLINLVSSTYDNNISMVEETFSDVGGYVGNVGIARGSVIENANLGSGNDTVLGNDVDNKLSGRNGRDSISGADGDDWLIGGKGIDTLEGDAGNDKLTGQDANDFLYGGGGSDTLIGGTGKDMMDGGAGDDSIDGVRGNDTLNGDAGSDTIFGGNAYDEIHGGDDGDILYGGRHADSVYGDAGSDTLNGGNGADHIYGGAGDDILTSDPGKDTFYFDTADGTDTITDFADGFDRLAFVDGTDFGDLSITTVGSDIHIQYLGGTVILQNEAGTVLTVDDFVF